MSETPDYLAAAKAWAKREGDEWMDHPPGARAALLEVATLIVDAAIGERRLVSPTVLVIESEQEDRRAHPLWVEGYHAGEVDGMAIGYNKGYEKGYFDALASDRIRVLDDSDSASSQGVGEGSQDDPSSEPDALHRAMEP